MINGNYELFGILVIAFSLIALFASLILVHIAKKGKQ